MTYTISPSSVNGQIHFKFTFLKVLEIDRECNIFPLENLWVYLEIYLDITRPQILPTDKGTVGTCQRVCVYVYPGTMYPYGVYTLVLSGVLMRIR